jgi:protein involved in polysaccharide export with SLBB domain
LLIAALAACALSGVAPAARAQGMTPDEMQDVGSSTEPKGPAERARALEARGQMTAVVQAGSIDPTKYVLGPGDVLEVDLWGRVVRVIPLEVSPEGKVFVPGRGPLNVGGRTLDFARDRITHMIAELYVGVNSDVRLVRLRTFKVYVAGVVKQAGALEVTPVTRASEVISRAGLGDGGSRRNIEVRRLGGGVTRLDLDAFENLGRQDADPLLVDGDVLLVPKAQRFVDITGAVPYGGHFELAPGDSMSTMLELAGGLLPAASPEQALMVRFTSPTERESLSVDLRAVVSRQQDFALRDGDHLYIRFRPEYHQVPSVGIWGEVIQPGTYPIVLGRDRLSDLVRWAGGFRPEANSAAIHLVREGVAPDEKDPELDRLARLSRNDMTEVEYTVLETKLAQRKNSFRVDWTRLHEGRRDLDPLLQDGDLVRVDRLVNTVRIEGQVKRPGYVDYVSGRSVGEYIQLAGGFTERSARNAVRVSRALTGQIIPARSLRNIQPGDFIWVPERRDVDAWSVFRDIATVAGQVAVIIFTLGRR